MIPMPIGLHSGTLDRNPGATAVRVWVIPFRCLSYIRSKTHFYTMDTNENVDK